VGDHVVQVAGDPVPLGPHRIGAHLLHLIRDDAGELGLAPAPGLADVPALVEEFRDGGLHVDARLAMPTVPVPGGVDVSAYRVVQEALTNALKYGAGPVQLALEASGQQVRISCSNAVGRTRPQGSGLGLQGMAERVGLLGGTLRHGERGDRFEIDVTLPVGAA
jgi:signal transduction histidine kinase